MKQRINPPDKSIVLMPGSGEHSGIECIKILSLVYDQIFIWNPSDSLISELSDTESNAANLLVGLDGGIIQPVLRKRHWTNRKDRMHARSLEHSIIESAECGGVIDDEHEDFYDHTYMFYDKNWVEILPHIHALVCSDEFPGSKDKVHFLAAERRIDPEIVSLVEFLKNFQAVAAVAADTIHLNPVQIEICSLIAQATPSLSLESKRFQLAERTWIEDLHAAAEIVAELSLNFGRLPKSVIEDLWNVHDADWVDVLKLREAHKTDIRNIILTHQSISSFKAYINSRLRELYILRAIGSLAWEYVARGLHKDYSGPDGSLKSIARKDIEHVIKYTGESGSTFMSELGIDAKYASIPRSIANFSFSLDKSISDKIAQASSKLRPKRWQLVGSTLAFKDGRFL